MRSVLTALIVATGLAAASVQPSSAAMMSGQALAGQCEANIDLCGGYIGGVIDQWGGFEGDANIEKLKKCLPDGVTLAVLVTLTTDYLQAHADQLQSGANGLIVAALEDALAC